VPIKNKKSMVGGSFHWQFVILEGLCNKKVERKLSLRVGAITKLLATSCQENWLQAEIRKSISGYL
jgi:hypothetical protein